MRPVEHKLGLGRRGRAATGFHPWLHTLFPVHHISYLLVPPFLYRHLIWPAIAGGEGAIQLEYLRLFGTLVPSTETKPGEEKGREIGKNSL